MMSSVAISCILAFFAPSASPFLKDFQEKGAKLSEMLKQESVWTDPAQRPLLLSNLEAVGEARLAAVTPTLVKHLAYSPYEEGDLKRPLEDQFPTIPALVRIGCPAIKPLLDVIRSSDLNGTRTEQRRHNLALYCLLEIYVQGGFGKEMLRFRIQLELDKAVGGEKNLLQQSLQHRLLK